MGEAVLNDESVADWDAAQRMVEQAKDTFGGLHGVVNNAGILRDRIFHKMSEEEFDAVVAVHLKGSFNVSRAAAETFRNQSGGAFVHMTSTSGLVGNFGQVIPIHYNTLEDHGITDILNVAYRQNYNTTSQSDTGLTKVARDAYAATANKASLGTPSQFWVQRFIDKITLTIYPLPNSTAASNFLSVYFVKRIEDVGAYTNATDTPFRFVPCMISGLSYYLSMKFAPQRTQEMKLLYEDELARALSEDGSAASTFITPKTYYPNI